MAKIALDIDSTLHHYWDLLQRIARERYGVDLPYEEQRDWGISVLERDAIEAGTVRWDGDLFSGRPDWQRLLDIPPPKLTAEERHFLDHDAEELCAMVTDWETTNVYRDVPPARMDDEAWAGWATQPRS